MIMTKPVALRRKYSIRHYTVDQGERNQVRKCIILRTLDISGKRVQHDYD